MGTIIQRTAPKGGELARRLTCLLGPDYAIDVDKHNEISAWGPNGKAGVLAQMDDHDGTWAAHRVDVDGMIVGTSGEGTTLFEALANLGT